MSKDRLYKMRRYNLTGGMDQATNPFLLSDSKHTYLKNVVHGEQGTLSKDGGYEKFMEEIPGGYGIDLLFDYKNNSYEAELAAQSGEVLITQDGDTFLLGVPNLKLMITDGDLYKEGNGEWEKMNEGVTTPGVKCSAVNYLDMVYFAEGDSVVSYTNGNDVVTIQSDNNYTVKGKYLETLGNRLYLGHCTSYYEANEVVFTLPGSHKFFDENQEGRDTYETTQFRFDIDGTITGIKAYQSLLFVFTEDSLWYYNPETNEVKHLSSTGCVDHDTIKEIDGILYWASKEGVYRFTGDSLPTIISLPIHNKVVGSLWSGIQQSNWSQMSAGILYGSYYLWVGDLNKVLPGDGGLLKDVVVVYDTYKDAWTFYNNHPVRQWAKITNEGGRDELYFASNKRAVVHKRGDTFTHDGGIIDMRVRTKYFDFDRPESEKVLQDLFVAYRPENTERYIGASLAINGDNNYVPILNDDSNTRLPLSGAKSLEYQFERVSFDGRRARTASYEFRNTDNGVGVTLLGFTQDFSYLGHNLNYTVS